MRLLLLFLLAVVPLARAETPPGSPVREISPGIYEIGSLRLEQETKTVTFPAAVNMDKGLLEYLLVNKSGPTHESLLVANFPPSDLNMAMLLLGAKGGHVPAGTPPPQITADYLKNAPALTGDHISLLLTWKDKTGAEKTAAPEDWLYQLDTKKTAPRGPWLYTGSQFGQSGRFLADAEGIFVALVTNPSALINNPRKGHENDQIWTISEKGVPPIETPVTVTLRILPEEKK